MVKEGCSNRKVFVFLILGILFLSVLSVSVLAADGSATDSGNIFEKFFSSVKSFFVSLSELGGNGGRGSITGNSIFAGCSASLDTGLISSWEFEENSGPIIYDAL